MRVLISFRPEKRNGPFEAARLRKNIKGALELNGIDYVENIAARPDICHFLSPEELPLAESATEEGVPYVVSAFFCEGDKDAAFLKNHSKDEPALSEKAAKLLNGAACVFVPSMRSRDFLVSALDYGESRIKIVPPGVNLARFEKNETEKNGLFARYFGFFENEKHILALVSFLDSAALGSLYSLAAALPGFRFCVVGWDEAGAKKPLRALTKKAPANLMFPTLLDDDVYRSALTDAAAAICFGSEPDHPIFRYEAYSAKTPLIVIGGEEVGGEACYRASSLSEASELVLSLASGSQRDTIINAYEEARLSSLKEVGKQLAAHYAEVLMKRRSTTHD